MDRQRLMGTAAAAAMVEGKVAMDGVKPRVKRKRLYAPCIGVVPEADRKRTHEQSVEKAEAQKKKAGGGDANG